jgi:hypothetical protein
MDDSPMGSDRARVEALGELFSATATETRDAGAGRQAAFAEASVGFFGFDAMIHRSFHDRKEHARERYRRHHQKRIHLHDVPPSDGLDIK